MSHSLNHSGTRQIVRETVLQGEVRASDDANMEFNTVLGSCIATCLYDPKARVGGMNHFLLAEPPKNASNTDVDEHFGVYLMELLINQMMALGASKRRMKARIYGGANMHAGWRPIGTVNAQFARDFLMREGIELTYADTGDSCARRVHFRPATGQVKCRKNVAEVPVVQKPVTTRDASLGDVELF